MFLKHFFLILNPKMSYQKREFLKKMSVCNIRCLVGVNNRLFHACFDFD